MRGPDRLPQWWRKLVASNEPDRPDAIQSGRRKADVVSTVLPDSTKTLYLGTHTLLRMHPRQIAGIGERKARELVIPRLPIDFDRRYEQRVPDSTPAQTAIIAENTATLRDSLDGETRKHHRSRANAAVSGVPTFMNRTLRISDGGTIEWYSNDFDELPLDWRLKLYGFEPLSWVVQGVTPETDTARDLQDAFDEWIADWIDSVEIGGRRYLRRAWTPWAVSLRIQHWLRYLAWCERGENDGVDAEDRSEFRTEIYKNALFLRNHIERDVGGNHLIENGAALTMAGLAFENVEHDWTETGISILEEAGERQFLEDGCHFERSPMYHVMMLTRYLTVCDLLDRSGRAVPETIRTTASDATAFLRSIRPPDGSIPLLNDAVYGETLPLDACLRYADAVGVETCEHARRDNAESSIRTSGYHWLRTNAGAMLVDGGAVGPPHLPGHSHSDTLSVLLWIGDKPVVTDTGTFDYVSGSRRDYARGVRGHNTVQVGTSEPIAVGGQYLMGPRPIPESRIQHGEISLFEGTYEATPFDGPTYTHHRAVYAGDCWWLVRDTVTGHGDLPVRSRLHLHPEVDPSIGTNGVRLGIDTETAVDTAWICPFGHARIDARQGPYFPRFGEEIERDVLELRAQERGCGSSKFGFFFTSENISDTDIEIADNEEQHGRVTLDGIEHQLPECRLLSRE